jgi:hypothetical protein
VSVEKLSLPLEGETAVQRKQESSNSHQNEWVWLEGDPNGDYEDRPKSRLLTRFLFCCSNIPQMSNAYSAFRA